MVERIGENSMQTITIIAGSSKFSDVFCLEQLHPKRYGFISENTYSMVFSNGDCLVITRSHLIPCEYDSRDLAGVSLSNPIFYLLEFMKFKHFKTILPTLLKSTEEVWCDLDNEEGIVKATTVLEKLRSDDNWDWRQA
jgi:hypothetical protein